MCGILAYITKDPIHTDLFQSSLDMLKHRGPNSSGVVVNKLCGFNIAFGHRRLAILDLSERGIQPMERLGVLITFNGEIYNFLSLKQKLRDKYNFTTNTDTEVLIYSYIEWGERMFDLIEGMFAFVILDKNKNIILLARDHLGKKPLYYLRTPNKIVIASEPKSIINLVEKEERLTIDKLAIAKFLVYGYIPSPNTQYKQIKKLEAANYVKIHLGDMQKIEQKRFWDINELGVIKINEKEALEKLDDLLTSSVKKRLISDVPIGVFLSGGIDSSLILAKVAQIAPEKVKAYTLSYRNKEVDESSIAERVADNMKVGHEKVFFDEYNAKETLDSVLQNMDDLTSDAAILPLSLLARNTKPFITVALSGDGGDEVFGGYPKYNLQKIFESLNKNIFSDHLIRALIDKTKNKLFANYPTMLKAAESYSLPFYARHFVLGSGGFLPRQVNEILGTNYSIEEIFEEAANFYSKVARRSTTYKSLYLDCMIQIPDWYLAKGDRSTMLWGLELRNPLLDKELVEFMFSLPDIFKIKGMKNKYLAKKLCERYLPKELVHRKKRGFAFDYKLFYNHLGLPPNNKNYLKDYRIFILKQKGLL